MSINLKNLKIRYSFCLFIIFVFLLDIFDKFIIFFIFVSFHEAGHILTAKKFGIHTEKIIISPLGEMAVMKNIEKVNCYKRFLIFIAGPLVNIFFGMLFSLFEGDFFIYLKNINFFIAFFNLLPCCFLDGERLLFLVLSRFFPIMLSNKIVIRISLAISCFIIFIGIIQLILFPYNISFICLGLYLFKMRYKMQFNMTFNFYKYIIRKKINLKGFISVRSFYIEENLEIKKILKKLYMDCFCIFYININDKCKNKLFEKDLVDYIQKYGINGRIIDVIKNK